METLPPYLHVSIIAAVVAPLAIAIAVTIGVRRNAFAPVLNRLLLSDRAFAVSVIAWAALSALLFWTIQIEAPLKNMGDGYFFRALSFARTGIFGFGGKAGAFSAPGYPFMLVPMIVLLRESFWAIFLTNLTCMTVCTLLVRSNLVKAGITPGHVNLASLFLLVYPNRWLSVCIPVSDVQFSLISAVTFSYFLRFLSGKDESRSLILAGISSGLSAMVRSTGLLLSLPLFIGIWAAKAPLRTRTVRVLTAAAASVIVLLPWTVRNFQLFNAVVPVSTNGGYNLFIGNNQEAGIIWNPYADSIFQRKGDPRWNEAERDRFWTREALAFIADHPAQFIARGAIKVVRVFSSDTYVFSLAIYETNLNRVPWFIWSGIYCLNNALYYLIFIAAALMALRRWRRPDPSLVAYAGTFLCVLFIIVCSFGMTRFKEPLNALSILFFLYSQRGGELPGAPAASGPRVSG